MSRLGSFQPDESSMAANAKPGSRIPFRITFRDEQRIADHGRKNAVCRVRNTPYTRYVTDPAQVAAMAENPILLVPSNSNRISLILAGWITNKNAAFDQYGGYYSFGYPVKTQLRNGVPFYSYGIPMPGINILVGVLGSRPTALIPSLPRNGSVSTDDIYFTIGKVRTGNGMPITEFFVAAYEGVLAAEANELRVA